MALRRVTFYFTGMLILMALASCSRENSNPLGTSPANETALPAFTLTPLPTPTATAEPTATPSPTPVFPNLEVHEQTLTEDGLLTIDSASLPNPGWLVVYQVIDGAPGSILGYEEIPEGTSAPLTISVDARSATPLLLARLHQDSGTIGEFEFPDGDMPIAAGEGETAVTFAVDLQLPMPSVTVTDQALGSDGVVTVDHVYAEGPSWLVIHNVVDGEFGPIVGQQPIEPGDSEDVQFPIRHQSATEALMAVLYEDNEQPGGFDPAVDLPVLVGELPVVQEFNVILPPDILAYDQPIIDGKIKIERAVSIGPGWITAYFDDDGQPGLIIGFAHLNDGLNENVELDIIETAVTPRLFLNLHEDTDNIGEFDFPVADLPLSFEGKIVEPFVVHTNPGNYLATMDQTLSADHQLIVPLVVADLDTWLVIYTMDEGNNPDEIIAQTWLPAGINRNVSLTLPDDLEETNLIAMLHQDAGTAQQFDYPDGVDLPLMRNRTLVNSPIKIIIPPDTEEFVP